MNAVEPAQSKTRSIAIVVLALSLISTIAAAAFVGQRWYDDISNLKKALAIANKKNDDLVREVGLSTTKISELQKTAATPDSEKQELMDQVKAFALQAKACDTIKKKLHVKD